MGMSWKDAADWDFVEYGAALKVWNDRQKEETADAGGAEIIETEPPPIEWMIADDYRSDALGYKVH